MELADTIALFLQRRRCLIILDNCEHVLDAAARLAVRLIDVDGIVVLATSRELFTCGGSSCGRLLRSTWPTARCGCSSIGSGNTTPTSRSTKLMKRRSRRSVAVSMASLSPSSSPRRRASALSPQAIARRLGDRFRLLGGGRPGEHRQQLRDTVQWSYELLNGAEAALFERLSVFAGGFSLAAAEAVCSDEEFVAEEDVLDLLASLVDKSMVQRERRSDERFMLLETLRQFGEEQLEHAATTTAAATATPTTSPRGRRDRSADLRAGRTTVLGGLRSGVGQHPCWLHLQPRGR